ncbi:putative F-box protein [Capsicum chinense]|nr:putative F-box protein [Capsicum chinense]
MTMNIPESIFAVYRMVVVKFLMNLETIYGYLNSIRYEEDLWTEIAKFLDGKSLVMLASTSKWFHCIIMEECVWKHACLRDLHVPDPGKVTSKWINLYATAFNGCHSYTFRQQDKHIDWMRIGAFSFDSQNALLTENLIPPLKILKEKTMEKMIELNGCCVVRNIKSGIWIADLQLVRCPVCDLNTCDGTMQVLDARHIELFLSEGYQDGSWDYELLGSHHEKKQASGASAGIFDVKHIKDRSTSAVLDLKSWIGKPNDWQPKAMISRYAVAVNTNLQENEGLHVKFHVMKSGKNDEIVSIRISEQLQ